MNAKNQKLTEFKKKVRQEIKDRIELKASGWAGLNKKGRLVDRRDDPSATPIRQSPFLGFAEPKTDEELKEFLNN